MNYHKGYSRVRKQVTRLKITKPDGSTEIIEVTDYWEYNPQSVVPDAVNIMPSKAIFNTVGKETFLNMLAAIKLGEGEWNSQQYAIASLGITNQEAKELVESL